MASTRETQLIENAKVLLPANFVAKETDEKILAYLNLCLGDVNFQTPYTEYTLDNMPLTWNQIIIFGSTMYANMFLQLNYSLKDFSYSDYGLNLTVDRQGKLSAVYEKQLAAFDRMKWEVKKAVAMRQVPAGLGYPRYQSQIGGFLRIMFGNTFGTGAPNV